MKLVDNDHVSFDMSSYSIFLNMLAKLLKRLVQMDAKNVMKIIGNFSNEIFPKKHLPKL